MDTHTNLWSLKNLGMWLRFALYRAKMTADQESRLIAEGRIPARTDAEMIGIARELRLSVLKFFNPENVPNGWLTCAVDRRTLADETERKATAQAEREIIAEVLCIESRKRGKGRGMPREEANTSARQFLMENANITADELSRKVGCAKGQVPNLPAWRAVQESLARGRTPTPKQIQMTDKMEKVIGIEDSPLEKMIEDEDLNAPKQTKATPRPKLYVKK